MLWYGSFSPLIILAHYWRYFLRNVLLSLNTCALLINSVFIVISASSKSWKLKKKGREESLWSISSIVGKTMYSLSSFYYLSLCYFILIWLSANYAIAPSTSLKAYWSSECFYTYAKSKDSHRKGSYLNVSMIKAYDSAKLLIKFILDVINLEWVSISKFFYCFCFDLNITVVSFSTAYLYFQLSSWISGY